MTFALRLLHRTVVHIVALVSFFFALVLAVYTGSKEYHVCVGLPNGLIIGREALFSPGRSYWKPRKILMLPDGSALIRDDVFPIHITETTVYGVGDPTDWPKVRYGFAYRPDVGLVYQHVDPGAYARLESEAGEPLDLFFHDRGWHQYGEDGKSSSGGDDDKRFVHMGIGLVYDLMRKDPAYLRRGCHVSIFPQ